MFFFSFSPFEVKISSEAGPQQVRAWGPGLEGGIVGKSADFVVEAVGDDVGTLGKFHLTFSFFKSVRFTNTFTNLFGLFLSNLYNALTSCSGFSVEGPSPAKIECDDKGDGSCNVRYWPTEPGEYAVHVLCKNEDIQHSPFMAEITSAPDKDFYPDKVQICVLHLFTKIIAVK